MDTWVKQLADKMGARIVGELPGYCGAPVDPRNLRAIADEYRAEQEAAGVGETQTSDQAEHPGQTRS